jgi:hypothetical protein
MGIFSNPARDEQGNELKRRRTDQVPFSIIASDMTVVGDLETEGVVRIEGRVKGAVRVGSQILVTQGAVIEGDLQRPGGAPGDRGGERRHRHRPDRHRGGGKSHRRGQDGSGAIGGRCRRCVTMMLRCW